MAKNSLVVTTVTELLTAFKAQIVTDGWVQVVAAPGVYVSAADAQGRVVYIKPYEDTVGNFMVDMGPVLDGAGTAIDTNFDISRGCNFISATWDLYSSDRTFFLVTGVVNNSARVFGGALDFLSNTPVSRAPWTGFITGCRQKDSATAYTSYLLSKGYSELWICVLQRWVWSRGGISHLCNTNSTYSLFTWSPDVGWLDGKLACMIPLFHITETSASRDSERTCIVGFTPDILAVAKGIDLVPGDTVTLDNGVKYEFREHTLYWDEYNAHFLLWRMN